MSAVKTEEVVADAAPPKVRIGIVGLGKMGMSHVSIVHAHPDVEVTGVADSNTYVLDVLTKYSGMPTFSDMEQMLDQAALDAVVIATPTRFHADMVRSALQRGLHVFCEKPLCLTSAESVELAALAESRGLVTQVGYHNRFVGAFSEVKRLLDANAIGTVTHVLAEAYGPVVLRPKGSTWRSQRSEGGGCLYDYAAHPLDLLSWYLGTPTGVGGTRLGKVFSRDTEDEVASTLYYGNGATAQLSVNWSDESQRKMTTKVTLWGTDGRIYVDRQECQVYLRDTATLPEGYQVGWNVRYTTELTKPVGFYLRGEEYSAQIDHFVERVRTKRTDGLNTFASAAVTDRVIELLTIDDAAGAATKDDAVATPVVQGPPSPGERLDRLVAVGKDKLAAARTKSKATWQRVRASRGGV